LTSGEISIRWSAVPALAILLCLAALAPTVAEAATGSIAGTVTDASTAEPIEGVEVCAEPAGEEEGSGACGLTETDGTYFIGGLAPGQYTVGFWAGREYESQYYDGAGTWSEADPVEVLSGASTAGIDAELQQTAGIEGTVTATEDGLGVEEVEVCAYPADAAEENFFECAYTDSDGSYAIGGLGPGNYTVEFWAGFTGRRLAYQFWDHQSRFAEADVVALAEGERREGIDADLEPGARITGNVADLGAGPLEEVRVCSIDAGDDTLTICVWTNEDGNYGIRSLPAGSYKVVFSPELSEFFPGFPPGEEDDGLPTQFWDNQTTIGAANVISLSTGGAAEGIDARFGSPQVVPPTAVTPPPKAPVKKRKCRRGYRKRLVKGKRRCVKVRRHRRHRHGKRAHSTPKRLFAR
jgi:hypothetical protein